MYFELLIVGIIFVRFLSFLVLGVSLILWGRGFDVVTSARVG
jgi:hypothetical protein